MRIEHGRSETAETLRPPHGINGQPGALVLDGDGRLTNILALEIADGLVQTVRSVINADKLRHLGPLADVRALMHERRRSERDAPATKGEP